MAHVPGHNTVNPYEYYEEFTTTTPTYDTQQAYGDLGIAPTSEFLNTEDSNTGLTYGSMIPEYDAYNEEMLRTQFRSGVQEGYQGAVGQLGGIMGQAREQSAQSGFSGSGSIQSAVEDTRSGLQNQYGSAFSNALLSLTSGVRQERLGYQDSISDLLTRFNQETPENILQEVNRSSTANIDTSGDEKLSGKQRMRITNSPEWNPPTPTEGASYTYSSATLGQHTFYARYINGEFKGWFTEAGLGSLTGG